MRGLGERTRDLSNRATGDVGGDETQVIRLAEKTVDEERTQVIRPQLVTPPGDRTEVVTFPVVVAKAEPAPAVSIADAEAPDFAEDPTGRIVPAAARDAKPGPRPRTVLDMERPADEAGDDTTHLPAQRPPADDES